MTILIIITAMSLTNCRKDVSLPNPEFKKLFGQWEWVITIDSQTNDTTTPASTGENWTIEFKDNGIYKDYKNGKRISKFVYTFSEGALLPSGNKEMLVKITNDNQLFWKKYYSETKLIEFGYNDTLYLIDRGGAGLYSTYIKK